MRDLNDIRVALVVRALDRALASPHTVMAGVAGQIVTRGSCCEDFEIPHRWKDAQAVRAVVMAYALNAPDEFLDDMAEQAIRQHRWIEWWDTEGHIDDSDCSECGAVHGPEQAAALAAWRESQVAQ
jgi:hypothetical protein